jgi:hypothetical protein
MTTDGSITSTFPIASLSAIATEVNPPSYQTLKTAQRELNACASSVHSDAGGGRDGHLCLTIDANTFLARTGVAFAVPVAPPLVPVLPAVVTGPIITEANRQHAEDKRLFARYHDTDKALLKMLIAAVPSVYIDALCDPDYGYSQVTTLDMLTHLKSTYGQISITERDQNQTRMTTPWHPPTPIEALFTQLQAGVRFAAAGGEPISDTQVARMGYTIILNTGLFTEACREWRLKPDAAQTYAELKTHFRRMNVDRVAALTTATAGYHGSLPNDHTANSVLPGPDPHSANAARTDPSTELLTSLIEEIRLLRQAAPPARHPPRAAPAANAPTSYCWTHGSSRNLEHTSSTCRAKAVGHQDAATVTNKLGGTDKVWSGSSRNRST